MTSKRRLKADLKERAAATRQYLGRIGSLTDQLTVMTTERDAMRRVVDAARAMVPVMAPGSPELRRFRDAVAVLDGTGNGSHSAAAGLAPAVGTSGRPNGSGIDSGPATGHEFRGGEGFGGYWTECACGKWMRWASDEDAARKRHGAHLLAEGVPNPYNGPVGPATPSASPALGDALRRLAGDHPLAFKTRPETAGDSRMVRHALRISTTTGIAFADAIAGLRLAAEFEAARGVIRAAKAWRLAEPYRTHYSREEVALNKAVDALNAIPKEHHAD